MNGFYEQYFDIGKRGKAYQGEKEYREDLYAFLDMCIASAGMLILEQSAEYDTEEKKGGAGEAAVKRLHIREFPGSLSDAYDSVMRRIGEPDVQKRKQIREQLLFAGVYIKERLFYTPETGRNFKMRWLSRELSLSYAEQFLVLIAYAASYDAKYGQIFADLQASDSLSRPTLPLVFFLYSLFADLPDEEAGRLIQGQSTAVMLLCDRSQGISGRADTYSFALNRRTCSFFAGYRGMDRIITRFAFYSSDSEPLEEILIRREQMEELYRSIQCFVVDGKCMPGACRSESEQMAANGFVPDGRRISGTGKEWVPQDRKAFVLHSYGPSGNGKKFFLRHAAKKMGYGVIFADVEKLETASYAEMEQFAEGLVLESVLSHACVCLADCKNREETEGDEQRQVNRFPLVLSCLVQMLAKWLPFFVWISPEKNGHLLKQPVHLLCMEQPMLTAGERIVLWQEYGKDYLLDSRTDLVLCANQYILSAQGIREVLRTADFIRIRQGVPKIGPEHIRMAVRQQSPGQLGRFATLIPSVYQWEDLVVTPAQKHQMQLICDQLKYRNIVGEEWGFFKKTAYGRGVCALFYGSPGTGKTMAVQVMANELGLDLYRVDLSQMVSKYIGETEKNITDLFKKAKNINALLFFDEADALFAKRSEVKDSHDRNANAQTAHLLQKLEDYEGIVVLATNYINNIDDAFKRRIRFMVNFSFPPPEVRLELWNTILPEQVPCSEELDFEYYAQHFELSGSSIKEVLTNAAFIAAAENGRLENRHIIEAIRLNFSKYGKLLTDQDFGYLC